MNKPKAFLMCNPDKVTEPLKEKGWINTEDRISEILYGVIMALTFTSTISITKSDATSVTDMLIGALSCNTAWGLVDAVMYLVMTKTDQERGNTILKFVRQSKDDAKARQFIADALPPVVANALQPEEVEKIRQRISELPQATENKTQKAGHFKVAAGIFFIVFVEVLADHHPAICQAASKALSVDLKDHIFEFNRVVAVDDPFGLDRENLVEIATAARYKGRPFFA